MVLTQTSDWAHLKTLWLDSIVLAALLYLQQSVSPSSRIGDIADGEWCLSQGGHSTFAQEKVTALYTG
jgi:hypothetical protein